ncbi:chromate transporter [Cohnella candidum]|uniref:Chromate transporter n=1 Tax=Cohnella candidum TaxID=2674991 RepID=A0A3G3K3M1_9BACL|nr:chromate transporter [Cohnella candidum]AYQ75155.1 chromate transporter [Cohnella candidum]
MNRKLKLLTSIFMTFLKMGPLTFGGGYALIPAIEKEVVDKKRWLCSEEIADVFAVSGSVPGAVAVNSATFIGYRIAGISGSIAALLGILLPTFCLMLLLTIFYVQLKDNPKIEAAFTAIRATVVALIAYAAIKIGRASIVDFATGALTAIAALLLYFGHLHPLLVIVFGATAGVTLVKIRKHGGRSPLSVTRKPQDKESVYDYMI